MGNQESISNDAYIIKKKDKKNIDKNNQNKKKIINKNVDQYVNQPQYTNKDINRNTVYKNTPPTINQYNDYSKTDDVKQKIIEKQIANNALAERNMYQDLYLDRSKNNTMISYPSNSNNELSIPKKNFDNIKFTPFNFNDEINKFKNNIDDEKNIFEKEELVRRKKFEREQKEKEEYLNSQIQKFENDYNPWEILGLTTNDFNINNIKKAYKKSALKYHPDKVGSKHQDKFQLITQSYIYLLSKCEEKNSLNKKINKNVEDIEYEDNINEKVENIYISKDKFDINQFNKIFDNYKVPSTFDKGYSNLMNEKIAIDEDEEKIFGKKFNNQIFNAHFDNIKNKKKSMDIIEYQEPDALNSSINNLSHTFLGMDDIEDFGSMNSNGLSYTDYKKAHVDETLLIDVNKVKYKTYNSIDQLESDRSNISYNASLEDKKRYEYLERKKQEDDELRFQKQKNYDNLIQTQFTKLNQRLIVHK